MRSCNDLPNVLRGGLEYADDPAALESAQATYQEEQLYAGLRARANNWGRENRCAARVLDLCAATGLATAAVAHAVPVASATLVDTDRHSLMLARDRLGGRFDLDIRIEDACKFHSNDRYDLILMNSAYHHIEDAHKVAFLRMARHHLDGQGRILMGEHVIPPYAATTEAYRRSVTQYYESLIHDLTLRGAPASAVSVIRRAGEYCWQGTYEYKVSYPILKQHIQAAALHMRYTEFVWNSPGSADVGSIVLELASEPEVSDASTYS